MVTARDFGTALYTRVLALGVADGPPGKAGCFQRCYSDLFPDKIRAKLNFKASVGTRDIAKPLFAEEERGGARCIGNKHPRILAVNS